MACSLSRDIKFGAEKSPAGKAFFFRAERPHLKNDGIGDWSPASDEVSSLRVCSNSSDRD